MLSAVVHLQHTRSSSRIAETAGLVSTTVGRRPARSARACSHPSTLRTGPTGRHIEDTN